VPHPISRHSNFNSYAGIARRILEKAMTVFQLDRKPPDKNAGGAKLAIKLSIPNAVRLML
jgi:hypothetical protein